MTHRMLQALGVFATFAVAATSLAACGGNSGAGQEELDRARQEGAAKAHQQEKLKSIEKQLKSLKKRGNAGQGTPPPSGSTATSQGSTSCGGSLSVGPNTTCGFAANVEADYYSEIGSGSGSVYSYSPTTGRYYTMYCTAGTPHVCTGGNEASIYFP
jgi:predicted small secreted protein